MEYKFVAGGPNFNKDEFDRLVSTVCSPDVSDKDRIVIDLSPYSYLSLHEVQALLILLRSLSRSNVAAKELRLPSSEGCLDFLERWNFLKELSDHNNLEYFIDKITVGHNNPLPVISESTHALSRSDKYISKRVLEITRIRDFTDALDFVSDLYKPSIKSILIGQIKRPIADVESFVDIIVFELLKNVIQHVLALPSTDGSEIEQRRIGFVSMQTHDQAAMERYGQEIFSRKFPSFLKEYLSTAKNIVELSVVDEGAGLTQTLSEYYYAEQHMHFKSDLEAIKYACEPGTSRYKAMSEEDIFREMSSISSGNPFILSTPQPKALTDYLSRLQKPETAKSVSGYGLALVCREVKRWGGVIMIRSGKAFYCPNIPPHNTSFQSVAGACLPGVQVNILLPSGTR